MMRVSVSKRFFNDMEEFIDILKHFFAFKDLTVTT